MATISQLLSSTFRIPTAVLAAVTELGRVVPVLRVNLLLTLSNVPDSVAVYGTPSADIHTFTV